MRLAEVLDYLEKDGIVETTVQNAKIALEPYFEIEDHGILTTFIQLNIEDGWFCGFGGFDLRKPEDLHDWVTQVMRVCDTQKYKINGKYVKVLITDRIVIGIGNILKDDWFVPRAIYAKRIWNELTTEQDIEGQ